MRSNGILHFMKERDLFQRLQRNQVEQLALLEELIRVATDSAMIEALQDKHRETKAGCSRIEWFLKSGENFLQVLDEKLGELKRAEVPTG